MNALRALPLLCLAAAVVAGGWPAGAGAAPAADLPEVTIGVTTSLLALPIEVAQSQGLFAAEGVVVRRAECATGPLCLQQLFEQAVDLATASEVAVVINSFQRTDYAIVATLATATRNISLLMRQQAGTPAAAHGLQGKRIGVVMGTSAHYFLGSFLLYHGIDPRLTTIVPLQTHKMVDALRTGRIDAMASFAPETYEARRQLGNAVAALDTPHIYSETYNLVVGRRTLATKEIGVVKVLRALEQAQRYIAAHPRQARELMRVRGHLDTAFTESIAPGFSYRLSLQQSLLSTMEGQARWAQREGHVMAGLAVPNYLDFVEPGPLRKAVPTAQER